MGWKLASATTCPVFHIITVTSISHYIHSYHPLNSLIFLSLSVSTVCGKRVTWLLLVPPFPNLIVRLGRRHGRGKKRPLFSKWGFPYFFFRYFPFYFFPGLFDNTKHISLKLTGPCPACAHDSDWFAAWATPLARLGRLPINRACSCSIISHPSQSKRWTVSMVIFFVCVVFYQSLTMSSNQIIDSWRIGDSCLFIWLLATSAPSNKTVLGRPLSPRTRYRQQRLFIDWFLVLAYRVSWCDTGLYWLDTCGKAMKVVQSNNSTVCHACRAAEATSIMDEVHSQWWRRRRWCLQRVGLDIFSFLPFPFLFLFFVIKRYAPEHSEIGIGLDSVRL